MYIAINQTMMPLAPTPIVAVPSKPKIGFSIDSIVGGGKTNNLISKHHPNTSEASDLNSPPSSPTSSIHSNRFNIHSNHENNRTTSHSPNRSSPDSVHRNRHNSGSSNLSLSPNSSPTPNGHQNGNTHIIRPSALNPAGGVLGGGFGNEGMKGLYLPEQLVHPNHHHHHHQLALAAAHFQAAGLAAALNHGGGGFAGAGPMPNGGQNGGHLPPHHPAHNAVPRDSYPLYPWLLSRHGRIFPHRFPSGPDIPGFLLQPFRKPKRIRTAFSPSQLLKLEHAFEKNHYVVGAERKQLAQALSLTETQVKVWFQNRRTKHKRMQQEEEAKAQQQAAASNKNNHHVSKWKQETQTTTPTTDNNSSTTTQQYNDIDLEVDVDSCSSGEET